MNLALGLTYLRILFVPIIVYLLYQPETGFWTAAIFAGVSLTDWLDGYVARRFQQGTELGKMLDPLADKILVMSVLIVFAVQQRVDIVSVLILVAREFLIMGLRTAAAAQKSKVIGASLLAKLKTAVQMVAIFCMLLNWPLGLVLYYVSFGFAVISLGEYLWQNRQVLTTRAK